MPTRKIYINTLAQIISKILTAIISIAMIKILTEYLGVNGYGLNAKIYNYLSIFSVIADMGLYTITVRELSRHEGDSAMIDRISGNVLTLRTISGGLILVLSLGIAPLLTGYHSPEALIGIAIVSIFTLLGLINSSLMSYLQATLHTEFTIIANTSGKLLTLGMILMCAGVWFPRDSTSRETVFGLVMLAGLMGNLLMTTLTWWYASRWHPVRFRYDPTYIRHILYISLPYGLALFLGVIFFKVDTIILSILEPEGMADTSIALYSLPMKIVEVGMMYGTVFLNSLLPVLTAAIEKKDIAKVQSLTSRGYELLSGAGLAIAVLGYTHANDIIHLISTPEFVTTTVMGWGAVDAMQIVIWIFFVYFVSSLSSYIMIAREEQSRMMWINGVIAILNIIGNLIVIPAYSFVGSAWVTLVTQVILMCVTWWYVRDTIHIRSHLIYTGGMILVALLGSLLSTLILGRIWHVDDVDTLARMMRLMLGSGVFLIVYVMGWWGLRYLSRIALR